MTEQANDKPDNPHNQMDVLIVEDHEPSWRAMSRIIERMGHTVRVSESVDTAIRSIQARVPDVVILDMQLPDGSGLAVYNESNSLCREHDVQWIAMTGKISEQDRSHYQFIGFDTVLSKPITMDVLTTTFNRLGSR